MYEVTLEGIDEARKAFGNLPVDKALKSMRNKLAAKAKTAASRAIRQEYNIKARDLSANMEIRRAKSGNDPALLVAAGGPISLIYFDAQEIVIHGSDAIIRQRATGKNGSGGLVSRKTRAGKKARGVTVKVKKQRKRVKGKYGHGGFIATGQRGRAPGRAFSGLFNVSQQKQGRGNIQLFERKKRDRLPIEKLTGPSIPGMLGKNLDAVTAVVKADASRIFNHELDFYISQLVNQQVIRSVG